MLGRPTWKGSTNAGGAPLIARSLLPLIVLMGIANDRPVGLQGSYGVWVTWLHLEPTRPHGVGSRQATRSFRQGTACPWPGDLLPAAGGLGCTVDPLGMLVRSRGYPVPAIHVCFC